jgi:hypothetical protein
MIQVWVEQAAGTPDVQARMAKSGLAPIFETNS